SPRSRGEGGGSRMRGGAAVEDLRTDIHQQLEQPTSTRGEKSKKGASQRPFSFRPECRSTLGDRHVVARSVASVELARTADLLARVLDHLLPLGDPADGARQREQYREHGGREAERLQRDA